MFQDVPEVHVRRRQSFVTPRSACFWQGSKVKWWLGAARARTRDGIDEALNTIMDLVTPADAQAWFKHCGYRYQPT